MNANIITQIIYFLSKILLPPAFIYSWGVNSYGEWLVIYSIVAYLSIGDCGIQVFIVNKLTLLWAQKNKIRFKRLAIDGAQIILILLTVIFFILLIFIQYNKAYNVINLEYIKNDVDILLLLISIQLILSILISYIIGVYRGSNNYTGSVNFSNINIAIQLILSLILLYNKVDIIYYCILQIICLITIFIIEKYLIFQKLNISERNIKLISTRKILPILNPSIKFFGVQISQILSNQGFIIVLAILFEPRLIVEFSTIRTLIFFVPQVFGIFTHPVWYEYTKLAGEKKNNELFRLLKKTNLFVIGIIVLSVFLLILFGEYIYNLWIGDKVSFNIYLFYILTLYMVVRSIIGLYTDFLLAINRQNLVVYPALISSLFGLLIAYFVGLNSNIYFMIFSIILTDITINGLFILVSISKLKKQIV